MNIILASESPSRKSLLERTGFSFKTFAPHLDEEPLQKSKNKPEIICLELAKAKAQIALKTYSKDLIIASDQIAHLNGKIYGKAYTKTKAAQTLQSLQGKTHQLVNGLYMTFGNQTFSHTSVNQMTMRRLSQKQIAKYIEIENPLHSAGSYYVERAGLALFEKIETEDFSSIIGFPITVIVNQLIKWGFSYLKE